MSGTSAVAALLAAARLANVGVVTLEPAALRAAPPRTAPPERVLILTLEEISRDQDRAWETRAVGSAQVSFAAGLDPEAQLWIKLRQDSETIARPLAELERGFEHDFPRERYRFELFNGNVRAFPAFPPREPQALVSVPSLVRGLYEAARRVLFSPVEYAVVYEDGGSVPGSVCLIREDHAGRLMITYRTLPEMRREIQWFVSIDGRMYGMKLEDQAVAFYAKPTPR